MKFIHRISPMDRIPHGYGVAWHSPFEHVVVCLPLPLNILAGRIRAGYHWISCWMKPSLLDDSATKGWERGLAHGRNESRAAIRAEIAREDREWFQRMKTSLDKDTK